jgi:hypothetical protein
MSQAFEIAVIRRLIILDEPEIHVSSSVLIKEAWIFMPNYMPAGIRVKQEREYRSELILPKGAFFQAVIGDVKLIVDNWDMGIVMMYMDSKKAIMDVQVYTSEILTNHASSQRFGNISYLSLPVVIGQVARVVMDERV